jgi:hypothetical protein
VVVLVTGEGPGAAGGFVDTTILAARCRVGANGVHYALTDDGTRVDCPAPVAVRAASAGLQTLGVSPVKAVALAFQTTPTLDVSDAELEHYRLTGNITALIALASGRPVPEATLPPAGHPLLPDFTSSQPGGRGVPEAPFPEAEAAGLPGRSWRPNGCPSPTDGTTKRRRGEACYRRGWGAALPSPERRFREFPRSVVAMLPERIRTPMVAMLRAWRSARPSPWGG